MLSGSKGSITYAPTTSRRTLNTRTGRRPSNNFYIRVATNHCGKIPHCLLVLDASTDEALNAIYVAHAMLRQGYPVRVAFVLMIPLLMKASGTSSMKFRTSTSSVVELPDPSPSGPRSPPRVRYEARAGSEDGLGL